MDKTTEKANCDTQVYKDKVSHLLSTEKTQPSPPLHGPVATMAVGSMILSLRHAQAFWHRFFQVEICRVRPLKVAILLLSVHPLLDHCLFYLHCSQVSDLPACLPQAPTSSDCS